MSEPTPLTAEALALLNKLAPHAPDDADELRQRAARNRRLTLLDELRIVERAAAARAAPSLDEEALAMAELRRLHAYVHTEAAFDGCEVCSMIRRAITRENP